MRKLRLLFASMFALLAWNGAFAQTDEEYNAAQAALESGKAYLISTVYGGTTYYLTETGYLTDVKDEAGVLTFTAVSGGSHAALGWKLGPLYFTNPDLSGSDVVLNPGHIRNNTQSSPRNDWEAQVFYLNGDGKYAVRSTNAGGADSGWGLTAKTFWTVNEGPVAEYSFEPAYVWEINEFVDERLPLFNTVSSWLPRLAKAGILEYTSNAKDPVEGSYEALTDGDYASFFHSTWHADNDPQADHYLQAELPNAVQKFMFYFKKRSQNNNNRPTEIQISASNDGENFTAITSVIDGLPTDESIIDFKSEEIELGAAYKFIRFTIPTTNNGATTGEHVFFTFSEFYILQNNELTQTIFNYVNDVQAYTDIELSQADEIASIEKQLSDKEFDTAYPMAMAAIEDGTSYRVFTEINGAKYYLNSGGYLVNNDLKANTFTFTAVPLETGFKPVGWNLGCRFTNPGLTNGSTGDIVNDGHIHVGGNDRNDWERQVFFLQDGKFAVRSTNSTGTNWGANTYWTAITDAALPEAGYQLEPAFIWGIEAFTDNRKDEFAKTSEWVTLLQNAFGLVQDAAQYSSNAKDPVEGSYEALLDNDYTTFFHSTWHSDNDPQADHYLQAELPNGVQKFHIYFKKRSQNDNNRPTQIVISASNDGENFTDITAITEGLPTGSAPINYFSDEIDLGAKYNYVRFTIPTTNNMAKTGDHVFFTFSEFYLLPASDLIDEFTPYLAAGDYTDITFEQAEAIDALNEKLIDATSRTIETDLTAQFPLDWQGWTGATAYVGWAAPAVTTNDGRTTAACEKYESTCANTGVVFSRKLTGLANGTYTIELYGAAAYTDGRGFESELVEGDLTAVYLYAETPAGTVKQYIPAHIATDFNGTGIDTALLPQVEVTDGTLTIGMYKELPYTNWHVIQIKGVTAVAKFADVAAEAQAEYEEVNGKVMEATAATNLADAKEAFDAEDSDDNLRAFQAAAAAAKASAEAYANVGPALEAMQELVANTNFYTEEAYNEYFGSWQVKYDERTLTTAEASAIQNPNIVTGWHAAITVDNFLLSVWDTNPDFVDAPYYINTWSVEGDNDGTNFRVPFFEYWTGDADSLGEKELTAQLEGLEPGNYAVKAWVRVRVKNGTDIAEATGITFSVNDGEAVDVTNGEAVGQFRLAPITACGVVGEDGILTVKFSVAAENNISWLSFKNVKYELQRSIISSTTGTFAQVENAKLSNKWEANEGPAFTLESPFNFMTAANLAGGAWTSVDGILEDPFIGFYSNDADAYFSVVAPDGIQITSLVIEASALKGSPVLNDVEIPAFGETVTIPYDNVQVATFYLGGDAAWMAATITVNYTGSTASQAPIATGVNTVKSVTVPAAVFNLAGQRVNKAQKGIYIVNGKKVVK